MKTNQIHGGAAAVWMLAAFAGMAAAQGQNRAIARMRGASDAFSGVHGYVEFLQDASDPTADVMVRVQVRGLTTGNHGFHVHQFGDVRKTETIETIGGHFVPMCLPETIDPDGNLIADGAEDCAKNARHGLPPSEYRQPGDMGNINIIPGNAGSLPESSVLTIGQSKMSLSGDLTSIVGRTVVVHMNADDGSQPYGNAGLPEAYGVIGLASAMPPAVNEATAPTVPHVTKVMVCRQPPPTYARPCPPAPHVQRV